MADVFGARVLTFTVVFDDVVLVFEVEFEIVTFDVGVIVTLTLTVVFEFEFYGLTFVVELVCDVG